MDKQIQMFGDFEIEKHNFLNDIDAENISISNKTFNILLVTWDDDYKTKPLYVMLPKTSAYLKSYKSVSNSMKEEFDSKLIYNKNFLETKIKSYDDAVIDFHDKKMSKTGSNYIYLVVILIDLVLEKDTNYNRQVFSKEREYVEKSV